MSMTEKKWEPGMVALVRWKANGVWRESVCVRTDRFGIGDVWHCADGWLGDATAKEVRPLVVIDLKPNEAEFVISVLENVKHSWTTRVADALRVLTTPPIEEPTGVGAVVVDADGQRWVHLEQGIWYCLKHGREDWAGVKAVRVLSEGVPTEGVPTEAVR